LNPNELRWVRDDEAYAPVRFEVIPSTLNFEQNLIPWIIYSKSKEEHEHHLRLVLQVLREHQLYAKLSKCSFYQEQIHYLGHIISEQGIAVDPKNIESIRGWPTPRNVSEIRSFMGLLDTIGGL
jgi:hypothetical protein